MSGPDTGRNRRSGPLGCEPDAPFSIIGAIRTGAVMPASRKPETVLGLLYPRSHGRHTEAQMAKRKHERGESILSAGREEAAREHLVRATSEIVENLLFVWDEKDDPSLSVIDNRRRRYARILWAMGAFLGKIGYDKLPQLGTHIAGLGIALEDLIEGVTDPLFVTKGSKRDSKLTWGARLQAAVGLECLILSGLPRQKAASDAARDYKALASLKRGANRDLKGSLLSWYDRYVEGCVPVPQLLEAFQETRREIRAANLTTAEYRRRGEQCFAQAVKSATR
jgi:hypothetical protein